MCTCGASEETGNQIVFEFEAIRAKFLGNRGSGEELDKAGWGKVGDEENVWYFDTVE